MAEWLIAPISKIGVTNKLPRVQIPLSPFYYILSSIYKIVVVSIVLDYHKI